MQNANKILDRLRSALKLSSDAKMADYLGVKPSTISSWRSRDSLDYDLIFSKCVDMNANWVLFGEGEVYKAPEKSLLANEPASDYVTQQLISFEAKTAALIERIENGPWSPEIKLKMVESMIRIVEQSLDHDDIAENQA